MHQPNRHSWKMFSFNISHLGTMTKSKVANHGSNSGAKSENQLSFEVFKDHWKKVLTIFNKSLINDDDIQIVKCNLSQMVNILITELDFVANQKLNIPKNLISEKINDNCQSHGEIWDFVIKNNIFENIFLWTLSYPEYLYDLKYEQLKYYELLINQMQVNEQTNLILFNQFNRPLFSLINHCSTHNSELIEKHMISVLNQLCVCMCKNSNLLNIFFENVSNSHIFLTSAVNELVLERNSNEQKLKSVNCSKAFIFTLLIPYIHREGSYGQQARDSLLMIMQLSSRNSNLAKYIVYNTDFCPILATGLSGLYSELPQKLDLAENIDEIRYLQKEDVLNIPSLNKFINSLEFCNNVIQVSHCLIANQLLQYVYYGFLIPVIAPALTQNNSEEIVAATLYLDLFLRTINEPNLVKIFLKFILYSKFDERITLLDTLIYRINANNKLCLVTLMLFYTLVDLNCEEVMYKLIFTYLMPCRHLMKSQIVSMKQNPHEINGSNAQTFLSLSTDFSDPERNNKSMVQSMDRTSQVSIPINFSTLNCLDPLHKWLDSIFGPKNIDLILEMLDSMNFNFVDYLKDSKKGILACRQKSHKWSSTYDFVSDLTNLNSTKILDKPSQELDYDPEEFLFNLNISSGSINENTKSTRSTMNLFSKETNTDLDSLEYDSSSIASSKNKPECTKKSRSGEKRKRSRKNRASANDFYILSFDNELSESSSSDESESGQALENNDDQEEEDEDLTATSFSSTATLNNEMAEQISQEPTSQYTDQLMDYFFFNEQNNKLFLNSSLDNFLNSIDTFFSKNIQESQRALVESGIKESNADLDGLCGEILEIYNQVFTTQVNDKVNEVPNQNPSSGLTAFPLYNESMNTSTNSSSTNNQTFDSGVESSNSTNKENDLGPFMCALLNRLDHMLTNNLQINFVVTGIFARLAYYPQLLLRSYLLNSNLVLQPNLKSLIQILSNVKFKIEACSKTYDNFSLLYLKAKVFLIKRLIDSHKSHSSHLKPNNKVVFENIKPNSNIIENQNDKKPKSKKIFSMESILNIFFKPGNNDSREISECVNQAYSNTMVPRSDYDFNSHQIEEVNVKDMMDDDFVVTDNDWEDLRSRNIACSAVVFDEFIKELAAICQEHSVLNQENYF